MENVEKPKPITEMDEALFDSIWYEGKEFDVSYYRKRTPRRVWKENHIGGYWVTRKRITEYFKVLPSVVNGEPIFVFDNIPMSQLVNRLGLKIGEVRNMNDLEGQVAVERLLNKRLHTIGNELLFDFKTYRLTENEPLYCHALVSNEHVVVPHSQLWKMVEDELATLGIPAEVKYTKADKYGIKRRYVIEEKQIIKPQFKSAIEVGFQTTNSNKGNRAVRFDGFSQMGICENTTIYVGMGVIGVIHRHEKQDVFEDIQRAIKEIIPKVVDIPQIIERNLEVPLSVEDLKLFTTYISDKFPKHLFKKLDERIEFEMQEVGHNKFALTQALSYVGSHPEDFEVAPSYINELETLSGSLLDESGFSKILKRGMVICQRKAAKKHPKKTPPASGRSSVNGQSFYA